MNLRAPVDVALWDVRAASESGAAHFWAVLARSSHSFSLFSSLSFLLLLHPLGSFSCVLVVIHRFLDLLIRENLYADHVIRRGLPFSWFLLAFTRVFENIFLHIYISLAINVPIQQSVYVLEVVLSLATRRTVMQLRNAKLPMLFCIPTNNIIKLSVGRGKLKCDRGFKKNHVLTQNVYCTISLDRNWRISLNYSVPDTKKKNSMAVHVTTLSN